MLLGCGEKIIYFVFEIIRVRLREASQLLTLSSTLFTVRVTLILFAPGMSRVILSAYIIAW